MKTRIQLNACGKPVFDLTYGTATCYQKKWSYSTTTTILLQAVEAGFATVSIEEGSFGRTHTFFTNDGKLIHKQYTDYGWGFDTWNPYLLPEGIVELSKEGVYETTFDDIEAVALMHRLPSLY